MLWWAWLQVVVDEEYYRMQKGLPEGVFAHHLFHLHPPAVLQNLLPMEVNVEAEVSEYELCVILHGEEGSHRGVCVFGEEGRCRTVCMNCVILVREVEAEVSVLSVILVREELGQSAVLAQ